MGALIDLTGKKFGRLAVVMRLNECRNGQILWLCKCDCGETRKVVGPSLRTGHTKSCGCWNIDVHVARLTTHGSTASAEYRTWCHMKSRCSNPEDKNYADYGARGISVCGEWQDFARFLADVGPRPKGSTLERIDNNKGYSKGNCRWATHKEQMNNTRRNRLARYKGKDYSISQLAELLGTPYHATRNWVQRGRNIDEAVRNYKPARSR